MHSPQLLFAYAIEVLLEVIDTFSFLLPKYFSIKFAKVANIDNSDSKKPDTMITVNLSIIVLQPNPLILINYYCWWYSI